MKPRPRKKQTHAQLRAAILLAFGSHPDLLLWPNKVGLARTLDLKRKIKYGTPGSADILGVWLQAFDTMRVINPNGFTPVERWHVKRVGQAIAIEVKVGRDVQSKKQKAWQAAFEATGGTYILARSVEDVGAVLGARV